MQTHVTLLEQYQKLSPFEQALLQLLSIVYEPAHSTLIVNCLRKLDLKNPRGNKPTAANLGHYFTKFEQLGLLTKERQCVDEIVEVLSKIAVKGTNFQHFRQNHSGRGPRLLLLRQMDDQMLAGNAGDEDRCLYPTV